MHLPNQSAATTLDLNSGAGYSTAWATDPPVLTLSTAPKCKSNELECKCPGYDSICCPDVCRCACSSTQGFPFCDGCA